MLHYSIRHNAVLESTVAEKSVSLVGGASSILGTGYGEQIDASDVVCRVNFHWPCPWHNDTPFPFFDATKDIGRRTTMIVSGGVVDIRLHRFAYQYERRVEDIKLVIAATDYKMGGMRFEKFCKYYGIPVIPAKPFRVAMFEDTQLPLPLTGLLAVHLLLAVESLSQLHIFGFDGFKTDTYAVVDTPHDVLQNRELFKKMVADPRVVLHGCDV